LECDAADRIMHNAEVPEADQDLEVWRRAREALRRALDEFESAQTEYLGALRRAAAKGSQGYVVGNPKNPRY